MAEESWVKMRVWLAKDPKVIAIAAKLQGDKSFLDWCGCACVSRRLAVAATVAALLPLWGVAREQGRAGGDDLALDHLQLDDLDVICDTPGIGRAMAAVGWARQGDSCVILPRFFRKNPSTEARDRKRERDAQRQRERRAALKSPGDVAATSPQASPASRAPRERGEIESNTEPPYPPAGGEPAPLPAKNGVPKKPRAAAEADPAFLRFWEAYPRKEAKRKAAQAFARLAPSAGLLESILGAVERQRRSGCLEPRAAADGRSVIPHPATWLNNRRWEDSPPPVAANGHADLKAYFRDALGDLG